MRLFSRVRSRVRQYITWRRRWQYLKEIGVPRSERVIVFFVPGYEFISGGILSIFSLNRFTREILQSTNGTSAICFFPGEENGNTSYKMFKNDVVLVTLRQVMAASRRSARFTAMIPEYNFLAAIAGMKEVLTPAQLARFDYNILNQNVELMPQVESIDAARANLKLALTCTTAHPSYSTKAYRDTIQIPVHHIPAWTYPDDGEPTPFCQKEDLMIVSPDDHTEKDSILQRISEEFPKLQLKLIHRMPFEEYLALTKRAKWSITFGEGVDDYFIGTSYRGGIGFACYNPAFFNAELANLPNVFPCWESLRQGICDRMRKFDSQEEMNAASVVIRDRLTRYWSPDKTKRALREFYEGNYTFP